MANLLKLSDGVLIIGLLSGFVFLLMLKPHRIRFIISLNLMRISFFAIFFVMAYKLTLKPEDLEFFRSVGRKGGLKHNPRKGFGSGDNARKAALARWGKLKKSKI